MGYPIFPSVPNVPGVPDLLRFTGANSVMSAFSGVISGTSLSVSSLASGQLLANSTLSAPGLITGTKILNQLTGTTGGAGTYAVNIAQSFAGSMSSLFTPPSTGEVPGLTGDSPNIKTLLGNDSGPQWGIFDKGGNSVVIADQVNSIEYSQDWRISTFPVEKGAFGSYDKVNTPFSARIRFVSGGAISNRAQLLESIAKIASTLDLYDVITPEKTYTSVNVMRYDYSRLSDNGLGLMKVDVEVMEVRETATSESTTTTQQPDGAGVSNSGTVQPKDVTPTQQSILSSITGAIGL